MAYETLSVEPERGGTRTQKPRVTSTEFNDGYEQTVTKGLYKQTTEIAFAYSGDYDAVKAVEDFFLRNVNVPFFFRFMPQEPLKLYKTTGEFVMAHDSGLKWKITATFKQYVGF